MRMRWAGFRKVRGQACKRVSRRIEALGLPDINTYRSYLEENQQEWKTLDSFCRVTISRFYRDREIFSFLGESVLPRLAQQVKGYISCWSIGCASGEEPYTLSIVWELISLPPAPGRGLSVLGTDSDPQMIERALKATYPASAIKDLPPALTEQAFDHSDRTFTLRSRFKANVHFKQMDIRESMPEGLFDLILCRNLAFTYFEEKLQREILIELSKRISEGGALVIGTHESLPKGDFGLTREAPAIYLRSKRDMRQSLQ
jgi:chemotaxis protein methyltransferase CheR